jgi:hypothetical protein
VTAEPPPPAKTAGLVAQILAFASTPTKAAILIVLALVLGAGWALYQKRDEIIDHILRANSDAIPELRLDAIPAALAALTRDTGADLVQVWSVDLYANSQWFIAAKRHDAMPPVIPAPRRLPIIVRSTDVNALINILEGHPTCFDLADTGSPIASRLAELGLRRACARTLDPMTGRRFFSSE